MSTAFDFSGFGGISAPSNNNFLSPWGVYDMVEFDGISDPVSGKRNDNTEWNLRVQKVLIVKEFLNQMKMV